MQLNIPRDFQESQIISASVSSVKNYFTSALNLNKQCLAWDQDHLKIAQCLSDKEWKRGV